MSPESEERSIINCETGIAFIRVPDDKSRRAFIIYLLIHARHSSLRFLTIEVPGWLNC